MNREQTKTNEQARDISKRIELTRLPLTIGLPNPNPNRKCLFKRAHRVTAQVAFDELATPCLSCRGPKRGPLHRHILTNSLVSFV